MFYKEMDFHPNAYSWNNMKTEIIEFNPSGYWNYLYSNVLYILIALDYCALLGREQPQTLIV